MTEHLTPSVGNLSDDILDRLPEHADDVALARAGDDGSSWVDVTLAEFHRDVIAVAKGLLGSGVAAGDRVALLSKTRYEWTVADYAIWWTGAVTVPIYETSSAAQIAWILSDSGTVAAIVENDGHLTKVEQARDEAPELRHVWTIDAGGLDDLRAAGSDVSEDAVEQRRSTLTSESLATLIYTSGTTGRPKGCRLTHGNFRYELDAATEQLSDLFAKDDASTLLFLPLAHVFARIIQVGAIRSGAKLGHTADVKDLVTHLGTFHPSFVLAVPRVFEKVFNSASGKAYADGKGKIFDRAVQTAIGYSRALDDGKPGIALRARHALFDRLVYGKLRDALGGEAEWAISGGAPLGDRLAHFYRGIGVTVLEGYGLTETTAALCVNTPDDQRIGSVGRPLPGTEVRVGDDGELSFRGPQVFDGYWHNDEATAEAVDPDGWFATGDLGEVDDDGFVRITGRKKEIIVTAGGKNVAPAVLEDRVRAHPLVSQCLVVGDGKPFVAALVTIDDEAWTGRLDDPELKIEVQKAVDDANSQVSQAESIRKFEILSEDWTEENGYLTPSFKVKRNAVLRDFHDTVEALFVR
ncbi:AMP-dependent synthetase/ligase [Aeromicrobium fastidiosum]|uniref:Acyl-CoA synthetase n=1 Tax=Aeromicrobium fastidiosum TaxID=52699 RepID=A0A641AN02_9ACTN|nr:AMP-dependent synthetase/ligase [Aeromicrobium fastidiosum]KAA1378654.1 long-chain fatty acid--CoA ligase [Aeromicrobium fastidiosum]MBP2392363.1 long-chain acyl-CoA synthetase [Aeromicrobium fastidiosum]